MATPVTQTDASNVTSAGEVDDFATQGHPTGSLEFDATNVTNGYTLEVFGHNNTPDDRGTGEGESLGSVSVTGNGHHTISWTGKGYDYVTIEITSRTDGTLNEWWLFLTGHGGRPGGGGR